MNTILNIIKKIIPKKIQDFFRPAYHIILAYAAALWYRFPSNKMIVISVTGTNGKSSTVELIARALEGAGNKPHPNPPLKGEGKCEEDLRSAGNCKVGMASTVGFKVGDKEWLNDKKMTMLGRFQLQKLLKDMVKAGCRYAVIETSSEGIKQFRHKGINYDYLVFTNLTPEHIESHGSFEKYKQAKLALFKHLERCGRKKIGENNIKKLRNKEIKKLENGQNESSGNVEKVIVVNGDDKYAEEFLDFKVDKKIVYGVDTGEVIAKNIRLNHSGTEFSVKDINYKLNLIGLFNVYNSLPAIAIGQNEKISNEHIKSSLEQIKFVPGRMEFIDEGQNFKVLVDYAPEPESMKKLYEVIRRAISGKCEVADDMSQQSSVKVEKRKTKIIHVLGSCGGGRDKARRSVLGKIAAENADVIIVTNEDPYDDDPMEIINEVANGALSIKQKNKKTRKQPLPGPPLKGEGMRSPSGACPSNWRKEGEGGGFIFKILDRKEAIKKAISLAGKDDLVLITGKGSEQAMCVAGGKKIKWDDREVVRGILKEL